MAASTYPHLPSSAERCSNVSLALAYSVRIITLLEVKFKKRSFSGEQALVFCDLTILTASNNTANCRSGPFIINHLFLQVVLCFLINWSYKTYSNSGPEIAENYGRVVEHFKPTMKGQRLNSAFEQYSCRADYRLETFTL